MKKVLVIYATAGIGHKKAAMAVKEALDELPKGEVEATLIDSLDYTSPFFKWSYLKAYLLMVNKLPTFWGMSYYMTDNFFVNLIVSKIRRLNNWINSAKLIKYIKDTDPDVIISAHFFAGEVVSEMKKRGDIRSKLITVVTDYRLHSWWIADRTDTYVVGGEDARADLIKKWKIEPSKIKVFGIPIEPVFSKTTDVPAVIAKAGFKKDVFTILAIGGGFGVGPIEGIVNVIGGISIPTQAIIVCGHNEELKKKLEALKPGIKNASLNIMGFVNNVYEFMSISDVLISKSGGITVSEAMAKELPMIVISPIIGQETRNCDFLVNSGAAIKIGCLCELKGVLEDLAKHPEKISAMKEAIKKIKKPRACYDIVDLALGKV